MAAILGEGVPEGLPLSWNITLFYLRASVSRHFQPYLLSAFSKIQILQLGGTEVGVALMSWRAWTPNFITAMISGGDCSLPAHPSSLPTEE